MSTPSNIVFIGEAMLELSSASEGKLNKAFAGDVFNTSVYLKRTFPNFECSLMTAVGSDALSQEFIALNKQESLSTQLIAHSVKRHMGAYMVVNDESGERSFVYWRSQSAAKQVMTSISKEQWSLASDAKVVFFSGISLAVLEPEQRAHFWQFLKDAKSNGALIIFDPNYRPALWQSVNDAKQQIETAFELSDWLMPGVDDFAALYGLNTVDECIDFCNQYSFAEVVLKHGEKSVHVISNGERVTYSIVPSDNVVDTTSAGDAFNGGYVGARMSGKSTKEATVIGNAVATEVIAHKGAIVEKSVFDKKWQAIQQQLS